ncbi:hypothetical protein MSPP1_003848 [Malassezia sp. CBS 17886]|nr:hypothetical protein MSPP1_003848 [Malassezia sp. CBS 17886]
MVRLTSILVAAAAVVGAASSVAAASPYGGRNPLVQRLVYSPKITYPKEGVEWTAGHKAHVSWDSKHLPDELESAQGTVMLGYLDDTPGEHLSDVLADGFRLSSGHVKFDLPSNITKRDDYIVVLLGDSGNASPKFTINAAK